MHLQKQFSSRNPSRYQILAQEKQKGRDPCRRNQMSINPNSFFFFPKNIYFLLFGCIRSQLQQVGFCLVVACRLSCSKTCGILVPQPGIEPMSPALEGRFSITRPRDVPTPTLKTKFVPEFTMSGRNSPAVLGHQEVGNIPSLHFCSLVLGVSWVC